MKTSKILLMLTAFLFLVTFIVFACMIENSLTAIQEKLPVYSSYEKLSGEVFNKLNLSSGLKVRIRQGKNCQVEIATSHIQPFVEIANGTLIIHQDSVNTSDQLLPVRITMPILEAIEALGPTEIHLGFFTSDSIHVVLQDSCFFESDNNQLNRISFETNGHTRLVFTEMMP